MTRVALQWMCRRLQLQVLQQLGPAGPEGLPVAALRLNARAGVDLARNLFCLESAGLVQCDMGPGGAVQHVRLQQLGCEFLAAADLAVLPTNFDNSRECAARSF